MQAFKLNKLFVATALALAFGPGARVVEAASLCGIPGASKMGMGCGGNTGTADSTLVPNVGAYVMPNNGTAPSWGGGGNTISGFLAENAGRQIAVYVGMTGPFYRGLAGDFTFSPSTVSFQPIWFVQSNAWNNNKPGYLPWSWNGGQTDATNLSITGSSGGQIVYYGGEAFDGNTSDPYYPATYTLSPSGITIAPIYGVSGNYCALTQDMLNAGYNVVDFTANGGYGAIFGGGPPIDCVVPAPTTTYTSHTCFPAGSTVLMADGQWKAIEMVNVGDWLMGADGDPVQTHKIDRPLLGSRRMMAMADDSLLWSEEHGMWTRDSAEAGSEWWWSASPERWRAEVESGDIGGLHDNQSMRTGEGFDFAHLEGWKSQEVIEASGYGPETQLYLPVTDGVPIIVNGYVVGAGINEDGYDYKAFRWSPARIADALARQALFRVMRMTPTHASSSVLAEAMA